MNKIDYLIGAIVAFLVYIVITKRVSGVCVLSVVGAGCALYFFVKAKFSVKRAF